MGGDTTLRHNIGDPDAPTLNPFKGALHALNAGREDMTIRKFPPKTRHDYVQRVKKLHCVPRAITRHGDLRGRAPLSATSGGKHRNASPCSFSDLHEPEIAGRRARRVSCRAAPNVCCWHLTSTSDVRENVGF